MDKLKGAVVTSEFWSAVVASVLSALVAQGVLTESTAKLALAIVGGLLASIFQRSVQKGISGGVPFQPLNK